MELLVHLNKRIKSRPKIQLPVETLLVQYQDPAAVSFVTVCKHSHPNLPKLFNPSHCFQVHLLLKFPLTQTFVFAEFHDHLYKDWIPQTGCGQTVWACTHSAHSHGRQTRASAGQVKNIRQIRSIDFWSMDQLGEISNTNDSSIHYKVEKAL